MTSIYLEKRIPARNQKRFYTITVTPTLFGSWTLMREWGPDRTAGHGAGDGVQFNHYRSFDGFDRFIGFE